ncbi:MAG: lysine 5,6-aminomutase subunit alpha [Oligoflexales bacterium]|nr:lysine 5,6-aminomutase subunit alpha [Oligoflexales bacterium]
MEAKLNLDMEIADKARKAAAAVARSTQDFIDRHTTVAVERTIARFLGIDGVNDIGIPLPNVVVDHIFKAGGLSMGVAYYIGNAMLHLNLSPQQIAEGVRDEKIDLLSLQPKDAFETRVKIDRIAEITVGRIRENRHRRSEILSKYGDRNGPLLYIIVATGNIYEDIVQAKAAAKQGADVIAVIRTTGQSLLDYVPYGATTEGFGGTYATQENFRLMRTALDESGAELGRYIRLCNYCSGLCMPEIAAMGALERLDMMLNDALYGILFRDINMQRTIVDQFFSRVINGYAGVIINTGEDNYLTTADAIEEAHTVLASQFINEQFARLAGLREEQMGLGHAFEMDPSVKNGFLYELAQAQMARQIFPNAPLKYMPPTKFMTGDIFKGHVQNALFNMITILTGQRIHLLGMLTEAIHTPFMSDRALSIENAKYIFRNMEDLGSEISFKRGGIMEHRANEVLSRAYALLLEIENLGLFGTLEKGHFGGIKRSKTGGKGLSGVVEKGSQYYNPFIPMMLKESSHE